MCIRDRNKGLDNQSVDIALAWIEAYEGQAIALPGVEEVLKALKAENIKIGLATNDVERNGRLHMEQLGLASYFDAFVGSDSGFGGKPDPSMIIGCAKRMNLEPSDCVMVGDTDRDTLAGEAAGCKATVLVLNGQSEKNTENIKSDYRFEQTRCLKI